MGSKVRNKQSRICFFTDKCNLAQKQSVKAIYSFLVQLAWLHLRLIAKFNPKIKLFVEGRRKTFSLLEQYFSSEHKTVWMHVASLGEYEQGLPVLEALKQKYPKYQIVLTFFSPSGYEVKKDKTPADVVAYLPMDTLKNVRRFIDLIRPHMAIFIKYEIWPNYLFELKQQKVPTFLVSAIFSKRQGYFKRYGKFLRKALATFNHFFVQEKNSEALLQSLGFQNVTISGDTRFDRVHEILMQDNSLGFMESFKGSSKCLVAGSTWPEDEEVLLDFINSNEANLKVVIAPHNINSKHLSMLKSSITKKTVLYSEGIQEDYSNAEVLIINTIGLLTKIYSYADFAYVGGGFATGLHNTLEPAVFGIPVIIGPKYAGFNEAEELVEKEGVLVVSDKKSFDTIMMKLVNDEDFTKRTGHINTKYIELKVGATQKVLNHIQPLL